MNQFSVSVIIPVYNNEKTLKRTLESVLRQGLSKNSIQIVLVNDGSADQSGTICDFYAKEYPDNIKVIHKENGGVSSARNVGMDAAEGKYLLFLDGDDQIDNETISEVVSFFDAHYDETDIVTYPLIYHYANGKTWKHWRYRDLLTHDGVYDVSLPENVEICQTTMNICVKKESSHRFDEQRVIWEDQLFIAEAISQKATIGFVRNAGYHYDKTGGGTIDRIQYPLYCYDDMMSAYEEMLDIKKKNPKMDGYADALIIYNCNWRIKEDVLLPYHKKGEEYEKAFRRFVNIVNGIENRNIMAFRRISKTYKYWLLSVKTKDRAKVVMDKENIRLEDSHGVVDENSEIMVVFTRIKAEGSSIFVLGYLKCGVLAVMDSVRLFATDRDGEKELALSVSNHSYFASKMKTAYYLAFSYTFDASKNNRIRFYAELNGVRFPTELYATASSGMDSEIKREYKNFEGNAVFISKNSLCVKPHKIMFLARRLYKEYRIAKRYPRQFLKRQVYRLLPKKGGIWLYTDSNDSVDDGFWQFMHDVEMQDGIKRYYVCKKSVYPQMPKGCAEKYKEYFVESDSKRHKALMKRADYIFAAFIGVRAYSPFGGGYINAYRDFFHFKVIYLQHGVMNAKIPTMYSNERISFIDGVVCSTNFEYKNLLELCYREKDLFDTGMSRLDFLEKKETNQKERRVLFAPSWRSNLVKVVNRVPKEMPWYYDSKFYRIYNEFLNSRELETLLEEQDLYLDVQMHPMFSCYRNKFDLSGKKRIREVVQAEESDYACLITDFSSIMFDFLYLDKPVIGFFPDRYEFEGGVHNYREFYFPLKDGFMLFTESAEGAFQYLRELCANGMQIPDSIKPRVENLFFDKTPNHRQRLYDRIMCLEKNKT